MVCSSCILRGEGERKWREEGGETCLWAALDCYADFFAANFSFHGAMAQMSAGTLCSNWRAVSVWQASRP